MESATTDQSVLPTPVAPDLPGPTVLRQEWVSTLFLHWQVDVDAALRLMPHGVRPDTIEGRTYVGLVLTGFSWTSIARIHVPYLGSFLQANVRLYTVDSLNRHGVYFLSFDAARMLPAFGARLFGRLPYSWSVVDRDDADGESMWSIRRRRCDVGAQLDITVGEPVDLDPTETWLTSRWGLHGRMFGRSYWLPVKHEPWVFRAATLDVASENLVTAAGIDVTRGTATRPLLSGPVHASLGRPTFIPWLA